jgi:hypothetical protein
VNWLAWAGIGVALAVALVSGYFGLLGQRSQVRSSEKVAQLAADGTAGQLALSIAQETRMRLGVLEDWEVEVKDWWDFEHVPWDEAVENALERLDPDVMERLPKKTPLPNPRRRPRSVLVQ